MEEGGTLYDVLIYKTSHSVHQQGFHVHGGTRSAAQCVGE